MNKRVVVDPITRIEGHLRIEAETAADGSITGAWSSGTMVRGIELILEGRDPREAWAFAQLLRLPAVTLLAVSAGARLEFLGTDARVGDEADRGQPMGEPLEAGKAENFDPGKTMLHANAAADQKECGPNLMIATKSASASSTAAHRPWNLSIATPSHRRSEERPDPVTAG